MIFTPNAALAALMEDMGYVLHLDGSQLCILKGAIVEAFQPFLKQHHPLTWSTEPPTQPGWYWDRLPSVGIISISQIIRDGQNGELYLVDNGPLYLYEGREWAGPIPEPISS